MRQTHVLAVLLLSTAAAYAADPVQTYSTPDDRTSSIAADADTIFIQACHGAIWKWAEQFDPLDLDLAMLGPVQVRSGGARVATLAASVDYNRQGGIEQRSADIECTVSADGSVAVAEVRPNQ